MNELHLFAGAGGGGIMNNCEFCNNNIPWSKTDWPKRYNSKKFCSQRCRNHSRGNQKTEYIRIRQNGILRPLHRILMENKIGRALNKNELVHHINGNKKDNRIENLEIISPYDHARLHNDKYPREKTCVICKKIFEPTPTKRKIAQCCSWECGRRLSALKASKIPLARSAFEALNKGDN